MKLSLTLNGKATETDITAGETLIGVLRRLHCYSVKRGCEDGNCGTCVVEVDGEAINACLLLAAQAGGRSVLTCEGLGTPTNPHPIQSEYVHAAAVQCGFCTPGLIMSTHALLEQTPNPTDDEIKIALDNNLCRCTGYTKILDAVRNAAKSMAGGA
jgi:carbon-monoxide dehydrogenase small subunit